MSRLSTNHTSYNWKEMRRLGKNARYDKVSLPHLTSDKHEQGSITGMNFLAPKFFSSSTKMFCYSIRAQQMVRSGTHETDTNVRIFVIVYLNMLSMRKATGWQRKRVCPERGERKNNEPHLLLTLALQTFRPLIADDRRTIEYIQPSSQHPPLHESRRETDGAQVNIRSEEESKFA